MPLIRRFEDINAWQEARKLARRVYAQTTSQGFKKDYGLVDQIRRAAVSVMNNIAEGFESGTRAEFMRFLSLAKRSAAEIQSCLYVALDRGHLQESEFRQAYEQAERTSALIAGFIGYLRRKRVELSDLGT